MNVGRFHLKMSIDLAILRQEKEMCFFLHKNAHNVAFAFTWVPHVGARTTGLRYKHTIITVGTFKGILLQIYLCTPLGTTVEATCFYYRVDFKPWHL